MVHSRLRRHLRLSVLLLGVSASIFLVFTGCADLLGGSTLDAGGLDIAAAPVLSPSGGDFTSAQSVTMTCSNADAVIHFTTDGSLPTSSSTTYTSLVNVATTTTIKAYATRSGKPDSPVTTATFTITIMHYMSDTDVQNANQALDDGINVASYVTSTSSPAYYTYSSPIMTYHFNGYAHTQTGLALNGSINENVNTTSRSGTVTLTGGTVTSVVYTNVKLTAPTSGSKVYTFSDGTSWTFLVPTGTLTRN